MPASQQQQGGGGSDNSLDFLWMVVLIVGGLALTWYFGHEHIVAAVLYVRFYELELIKLVLKGYTFVAGFMHLPTPSVAQNIARLSNRVLSNPAGMSLTQLLQISHSVGSYLTIPVSILIGIMAVLTWVMNAGEHFKHTYNMETLRKTENKIWPQVTPVMRVDLVNKDLDEGPWASSLTPMLFAKKHGLLIERKENYKTTVTLHEGAAYRVFSLQVGQFYREITTFPIHIQALFAIFLARANQDRKNADKLLIQIAASATSQRLDFRGVKETVKRHRNSKYARSVQGRHAYLLTVMATLLENARSDGVLATAEFIWLKPVDRVLWYMLNSVGRQTAFPEVAGVYAHWLAEKRVDRALRVPMVDEAVKSLDLAIKEMIYEPDEK